MEHMTQELHLFGVVMFGSKNGQCCRKRYDDDSGGDDDLALHCFLFLQMDASPAICAVVTWVQQSWTNSEAFAQVPKGYS